MDPEKEERARRDIREVERCRCGDGAAFARLVAAHQDNVHQFACSMLGRAEAEDAAQEVFLQAFRSLSGFRGESSFSTWLYSVARNVCRHILRASGAAKRSSGRADDAEAAEIPEGGPGILARLEAEETRAAVREAMDGLPAAQRAVLMLSHWEGMRYGEIARALDIPEGTVKSRMHNAVANLARALTQRLTEDEERAP